MKIRSIIRITCVAAMAAMPLTLLAPRCAAQNVRDDIEVVRGALRADRKVVIAEGMQLNDAQSAGFWPVYREYRAAMDKLNDGRIELVLEYADLFPDVPEDRAKNMLKKLSALEERATDIRNKYLKKLGKILPA